MAGIASKNTALKGVADALADAQRVFDPLFEALPDGVVVTNARGEIVRVNPQAETLFGYSREELLGRPVELLIPDRFHQHRHQRQTYQQQPQRRPMGARSELFARRKDGSEFPVDIMLSPVQMNGETMVIAVVRDVTERKRAQEALRLAEEKAYLEEELRTEYNFEEIVGESAALKRVLSQIEMVAPTDATVLVLGETGTGKELVARAIHHLSARRERTFVKLNCAAIPSGLLESELFGHEKGAFTGAISQKIGRLELAHQGTLFLDEVGDIPLELQPKLLRALQEKEFERLGSTRTIPVDVRLIAATNRDLAGMVKDHRFRSDLYYRLRVFPINVPPLRERRDDIPILVHHFVQKHARRMSRQIEIIPPEAMQALERWPWPGNVRELENLMERAVILSRTPVLRVPLAELSSAEQAERAPATLSTLQAAEREHILRVLRGTGGVIAGPKGAAARLGLKRTTLNSKMRRLGITRRDFDRNSSA